jgi:hypothetical protein
MAIILGEGFLENAFFRNKLERVILMSEFLRGNFKTNKEVGSLEAKEKESLEERFEQEALKKLGGSIAFVSKKKVLWDDKDVKAKGANK